MFRLAAAFLIVCATMTACAKPSPKLLWQAEGENPNDAFGFKGMSAGDVDKDGVDELLISASGWGNNAGKLYLYRLSGGQPEQIWTAVGEHPIDGFAKSMGGAGDVNGDGYDDVYAAAPDLSTGKSSVGRLYLYYGSAQGLPAKASWTLTGTEAGEVFGDCTSAIGDINKDGFDDLIVGAYGFAQGRGKALIYLGSKKGPQLVKSWLKVGAQPGDNLGYSHGAAGDVNGDGYPDFLLGSKFSTGPNGLTRNGQAWLYLGGPQGPAQEPLAHFQGEEANAMFANRAYGAGDLNGDGFDDIVIGAPNAASGLGRAYAYLGKTGGINSVAAWSIQGKRSGDALGMVVRSAGHFDREDSLGDVVVGAPGTLDSPGEVQIYRGTKEGLSPNPAWTLQGEAPNDGYGQWVAKIGGYSSGGPAIIVGAPGNAKRRGKAYLYGI